jgi:uncharacterized protein (DUF427 family)
MSQAATAHDLDVWADDPDAYRISFEPSPRRVRANFAGETVVDSRRVMVMLESRHIPVYYFPKADVRMDLLGETDHHTHCPFKGDAAYWSLRVGERVAENAVWGYPQPIAGAPDFSNYVAFYWDKMDHWYEEDEEVFVHARDPYKRIDAIWSNRHVRVVLGGETVAESQRPCLLFETGFPTRYYLKPEDVRADLLQPSDKVTACPYKGEAHYNSARVGDALHENIVWYYPEPIPECAKIKDLLCFFNEHVDEIIVDGEVVPKVKTPWS